MSASMESARRLFEIVEATPVVREPQILNNELQITNPQLRVTKLSFTYPGSFQPVLEDVSFNLDPGQRVAIVGPSGAGKSTIGNLLLRFWDYSQGEIRLDGRDLHAYAGDEIRRMVSVISQRTYFFNESIRQNLLLARPMAEETELMEAMMQAQIHEFITGLPRGYETVIGERGLLLSGGERQRLAIARALLKKAPILLLDEPTANLDPVTERAFLDTLFSLGRIQSLLLITHRLVGLESMDEILVLNHGHIAERGSHTDLLARGGLYRRMWDFQNRIIVENVTA
jgi:ABC-type multidrug transport system fused ATPase/permease subunit